MYTVNKNLREYLLHDNDINILNNTYNESLLSPYDIMALSEFLFYYRIQYVIIDISVK